MGAEFVGWTRRIAVTSRDACGEHDTTPTLRIPLDLANPPVPAATIQSGSTWYFQGVFRDVPAGGAEFNFSDGLEMTFL